MILVFINELGPNFKGHNIYEFIFSDFDDVYGDNWDSEPANSNPSPPLVEFIKKVGVLKHSKIEFELIQNSDFFSMYDSIDGIISLGWEKPETHEGKRLVFSYGETLESVENKLYEKDIVLKWEKNLVQDETYES